MKSDPRTPTLLSGQFHMHERETLNESQGRDLTLEESEACAVLVACMRRGWTHLHNPRFGHVVLSADGVPLASQGWLDSPAAAYLAALEQGQDVEDA